MLKIIANKIRGMYANITPLNKKIIDGIIDNVNALSLLFLFQQIIQNKQYNKHKIPLTIK